MELEAHALGAVRTFQVPPIAAGLIKAVLH